MKTPLLIVLTLTLMLTAGPGAAPPASGATGVLTGAHGDTRALPKTCRACHRGMSMKISGEERTCLACHGSSMERQAMVGQGYLRGDAAGRLANIEAELRKPYNHPVLTVSGVHLQGEALPEEQVNARRHAECVDCHHPHEATVDNPLAGLPGRRVGNFVAEIEKEYELCYRCHAESANLPAGATNKHAEFRPSNPSFHPVEAEGRNAHVISLKEPYAARQEQPGDISVITCGDCHGSDDAAAPDGPHGSSYRGLLVANYEMTDGRPESAYAYALCYRCHDRASILANESFPYHARHIQGSTASGQGGASCHTCHDAHGSPRYQYLIRFDETVVEPNADNKLEFQAQGVATRNGACLLRCHGVEHNPRKY